MIQKMFAVVDLFLIGLLNSFVPNVESLAVTSLPGGLKSAFILYRLYGWQSSNPRNAFLVRRLDSCQFNKTI